MRREVQADLDTVHDLWKSLERKLRCAKECGGMWCHFSCLRFSEAYGWDMGN